MRSKCSPCTSLVFSHGSPSRVLLILRKLRLSILIPVYNERTMGGAKPRSGFERPLPENLERELIIVMIAPPMAPRKSWTA